MADFNPARRHTYTAEQIQQYYETIKLPPAYRETTVSKIANASECLQLLTSIQRHHLAAIPFENLELHYSSHHTINLDPEHLFHKIVERNAGRGGYCMENSALLGTVLRSLGFEVKSIGAKVNECVQPQAAKKGWKGPVYDGWNHMINIITIDGKKYLVDVGFGSSGPTRPLPLVADDISPNVGAQEIRLLYEPIPDFTSPDQKLWIYQHRNTASEAWVPTYAFTELEFTPNDYLMMNHFTSTSRTSWFTTMIVCVKMLMSPEGEIVGDVTLFGNEVKRRLRGETEVLKVCETEEERVAALQEFLGVRLSRPERDGIKGFISEL